MHIIIKLIITFFPFPIKSPMSKYCPTDASVIEFGSPSGALFITVQFLFAQTLFVVRVFAVDGQTCKRLSK